MTTGKPPAPMAAKAARLLKFLAREPSRWYSLSELARELGLGRGTMHGLLATLVEEGFLLRDPRDKRYALGPALVAIGEAASSHRLFGLARMASDEIRKLAASFDAQATTSCVVGEHMLIVDAAGGPDSFGRVTQVGEQVPLEPPMGAVFLAWASKEAVEAWISRAKGRPGGPLGEGKRAAFSEEGLRSLLDAVRRRGFSASIARHALGGGSGSALGGGSGSALGGGNEGSSVPFLEVSYDTDLVAAPAFDSSGEVVLALSLFGFPHPLDEKRAMEVGLAVRQAAGEVTRRLGGSAPWDEEPRSASGGGGKDAGSQENEHR